MNPSRFFADVEEFVNDHRRHGTLAALLQVACPCGVVFGRWVTPGDAELDLLRAARLN